MRSPYIAAIAPQAKFITFAGDPTDFWAWLLFVCLLDYGVDPIVGRWN